MNVFENFKVEIRKAVQKSESLDTVKRLLALEDAVNDFLDNTDDEELEKLGSKRGRRKKKED